MGVTARTGKRGCKQTARRVLKAGSETAIALGNIGDPDDVKSMVEEIRDRLGPIDVLVNNATYRPSKSFFDVETEDIARLLDVNSRGVFQTTPGVVPDMKARGGDSAVNLIGAMVSSANTGTLTHTVRNWGSKGKYDSWRPSWVWTGSASTVSRPDSST